MANGMMLISYYYLYFVLCFTTQSGLTLCNSVAHEAPLSMESSRQKYWSGLPFPIPGNFPDPGIKPESLASPALAGRFFTTSTN